jgi:hypothetical protein
VSFPLVYRFRPAENADWCWFDVMLTVPVPEGAELPRDVPVEELPWDEPWSNAPQLGGLGPVYDQDASNLPKIQRGLHNDSMRTITLARYQERNIRHFHDSLEKFLAR